jgi:hypothetical protein
MAALLTSEKGNRDKVIKHISVCKEMGINVLPPDINQSALDFSVDGGNIRFGLAAVKNVGESAIESIIESRDQEGSFKSFLDFCSRVELRKINKRVVESLIKCGAFDSLKYGRRQLMEGFERTMDAGQKLQDQKLSDQAGLFDGPEEGAQGLRFPRETCSRRRGVGPRGHSPLRKEDPGVLHHGTPASALRGQAETDHRCRLGTHCRDAGQGFGDRGGYRQPQEGDRNKEEGHDGLRNH